MASNMTNSLHFQKGISLVELLISLALGLIVVAAVGEVFISNRNTFRAQEAISQVQQNARIGIEMLANDIREAGGNPCGAPIIPAANIITDSTTQWWANWQTGTLHGYENTEAGPVAIGIQVGDRVAGTDAIMSLHAIAACDGNDLVVVSDHLTGTSDITVQSASHCIKQGDVVLVCDTRRAAIFQASSVDTGARTITHGTGAVVPGNLASSLGIDINKLGIVNLVSASFWYIGNNDRGGRSLFRAAMVNDTVEDPPGSGTMKQGFVMQRQEMADSVTDMQITYATRVAGTLSSNFMVATLVPDWTTAAAARITLTLNSSNNAGADLKPISRQYIQVISLRNQEVVQ